MGHNGQTLLLLSIVFRYLDPAGFLKPQEVHLLQRNGAKRCCRSACDLLKNYLADSCSGALLGYLILRSPPVTLQP